MSRGSTKLLHGHGLRFGRGHGIASVPGVGSGNGVAARLQATDSEPLYWYARTLQYLGRRDEEESALRAAKDPSSAWILTARSAAEYGRGHIDAAQQLALAAVKADVCNAEAHLQAADMLLVSAQYGQARRQVLLAHTLDQSSAVIYSRWLHYQSDEVRLQEYERHAADASNSDVDRQKWARLADQTKETIANGRHVCKLTSSAPTTTVSMAPLMEDGANIRAWGLSVKINDHATTVLLDTGGHGLVLNHAAAASSGLKLIAHGHYGGIGDDGPAGVSYAYADHIRIGTMEFSDCVVLVDDRRSVASAQGLIGTDVFKNEMITLDFPLRQFTIAPLPHAESPGGLETGSDSVTQAKDQADAYDGPELKDFSPVYLIDTNFYLPTTLNGKPELMLMDTGSESTLFDATKAKEFTSVHLDNSFHRGIEGVSGKVNKVYTTGDVLIKYGNLAQYQNGAFAIELNSPAYIERAGLLGASFLYNLVVDIDYRDARLRLTYDRNHGHNALMHR